MKIEKNFNSKTITKFLKEKINYKINKRNKIILEQFENILLEKLQDFVEEVNIAYEEETKSANISIKFIKDKKPQNISPKKMYKILDRGGVIKMKGQKVLKIKPRRLDIELKNLINLLEK